MYDSIRPYNDHEVREVLQSLATNSNLLDLLASYRMPRLNRMLPQLSRSIISYTLHRKIRDIDSVDDLQKKITAPYLCFLLEKTVASLQEQGLEQLHNKSAALFISNHRDIVLDSALTNYCLYKKGFGTFRIATGDNLASIPFARDIMKLNKSFWVPRSSDSPRQKLIALKELSCYIYDSITMDHESVWIAHREGRAKDSFDKCDAGVLKMLHLCHRNIPIKDYFSTLNMHPVSISYEYDPCDLLKACERYELAINGRYDKKESEDMLSVVTGLKGFKGKVNIAFCPKVSMHDFDSKQQLADIVDREIISNYYIFPSNLTALRLLKDKEEYRQACQWLSQKYPPEHFEDALLQDKCRQAPKHLRQYLLENYANPCLSLWRIRSQTET